MHKAALVLLSTLALAAQVSPAAAHSSRAGAPIAAAARVSADATAGVTPQISPRQVAQVPPTPSEPASTPTPSTRPAVAIAGAAALTPVQTVLTFGLLALGAGLMALAVWRYRAG